MSNFYIADCHFGHSSIINFDGRPFFSVLDMNKKMIENWNSVVSSADIVYILGDLIWYKENQWSDILKQLNGEKFLILGNHDPKKFSAETKRFFCEITKQKEISDCGKKVIMNHCPIPFYAGDYKENCYMLYGHVHATREYQQVLELRKHIKDSCTEAYHNKGNFINIGCMMPWMNYSPRTLDEIISGDAAFFDTYCKETP